MSRNFCSYENEKDNNKLYPVTDLNFQPLMCGSNGKCFKFNFDDVAKNPANYSGETTGQYVGFVDAMKITETTNLECNRDNGKIASLDKNKYMVSTKNTSVSDYIGNVYPSIIQDEKFDQNTSKVLFKFDTTNISDKYRKIQELFGKVVNLGQQASILGRNIVQAPAPPTISSGSFVPLHMQSKK
jgi:hypothetical protein